MRNALAPGAPDGTDGIFDTGRGLHASSGIGLALVNDAHGDPNVFIRLTRIGDVNLDGSVTISDFIDLASHFNGAGTWQEGDLNYDGQVTISDFIDLASNFGGSYSGEAFPISPQDQQTLSTFAAAHGVAGAGRLGALPRVRKSQVLHPANAGTAARTPCQAARAARETPDYIAR
jgi:hypothetical protein